MKDHLIGSVPAHLVDAARPTLTAHEGLVADYNIAAWLHLPDACDLLVSLVVSYLDGGASAKWRWITDESTASNASCFPALPACPYGRKWKTCRYA